MKDMTIELKQGSSRDALAALFAAVAVEAGAAVMAVYGSESRARRKADGSPVSEADEAAEAVILKRLAAELPDLPVLAEEAASRGGMAQLGRAFILVDPLDGTIEFLSRNGEFTVNIALIVDAVPCAGVVYAPALEKLWIGGATARACSVAPGAKLPPPEACRAIHARKAPQDGWTALMSRSHPNPAAESFLKRLPIKERRQAGSSLKFCVIAEGEADVYPRFGTTMEWDTAAGDAVLRVAGGIVTDPAGRLFRYGKAEAQYENGPFVAWGDPKAASSLMD
jgi:3'(2'), 5'-bisphosphate nucleotidase